MHWHKTIGNTNELLLPSLLDGTKSVAQGKTGEMRSNTDSSKVDRTSMVQTLLAMCVDWPIMLKNTPNIFLQISKIPEPRKNVNWKIFAWRISGK